MTCCVYIKIVKKMSREEKGGCKGDNHFPLATGAITIVNY